MARGPWKKTLWWDEKLSDGKSPKQIVRLITKDFGLKEQDVPQILTRYLTLKEKKFFKKGARTIDGIIVTTYLFCSHYMLGTDPINPQKFSRICKKNKFKISYRVLMKHVREAKKAKLFGPGPSSEKIISRFIRSLAYLFKLDQQVQDEIKSVVAKHGTARSVGGTSPFVVVAGFSYLCARRHLLNVTQKQLCDFFGTTEVSLRNFVRDHGDLYTNEFR